MISAIRKFAEGTVAKIVIFGVLILSFGLWGVADYISPSGEEEVIAWVDEEEILYNDFLRFVDDQKRQMNLVHLSNDDIKKFGLQQLFLDRMIDRLVLQKTAENLALTASDSYLVHLIRNDANFLNGDGAFSREKFNNFLSFNNISEGQYIEYLRDIQGQLWLQQAIDAGAKFHFPSIASKLAEYRAGITDVKYITLNTKLDTPAIDAPPYGLVEEWYENNQSLYTVPEYRKIQFTEVTIEDIAKTITIDQQALKEYYEQNIADFATEFSVSFTQYLAHDKEDALAIYDYLKNQGDREKVTEKFENVKVTDIDQASKNDLKIIKLDAIADAQLNEVTAPIEGSFGWTVAVVTQKKDGATKDFAEVKDTISDILARETAEQNIQDLRILAEDAIAGGANFKEVHAQLTHASIAKMNEMDNGGLNKNNEPVAIAQQYPDIIESIFSLNQGEEPLIFEVDTQSFTVVDLVDIEESNTPSYSEIATIVNKDWIIEKQREALLEKAEEYRKEVNNLDDFIALSKKLNKTIVERKDISRQQAENDPTILNGKSAYFLFDKKERSVVIGNFDDDIVLAFIIAKRIDRTKIEENLRTLLTELTSLSTSNMLSGFMKRTRKNMGVRINSDLL